MQVSLGQQPGAGHLWGRSTGGARPLVELAARLAVGPCRDMLASCLSSLILISFLERQGLAWTCDEDGCRWTWSLLNKVTKEGHSQRGK